jgi:3-deoxy-D-arabino-heptulosonate 7-phosphate (DAHP) synthase
MKFLEIQEITKIDKMLINLNNIDIIKVGTGNKNEVTITMSCGNVISTILTDESIKVLLHDYK